MSVGVIGGADGPTAIIVSGSPWAAAVLGAVVLAAIVLCVLLWRRRKK